MRFPTAPSRRSLLASTAGLAAAALAGCSSAVSREAARHYVDVMNGTEQPHGFVVTATDEGGETLFEHEYELAARTGDENRIIDGTPVQVTVVVDGTERVQFPWAPRENPAFTGAYPDGCSDATATSLTIWYGKQSEPRVEPVYSCETVRDGK